MELPVVARAARRVARGLVEPANELRDVLLPRFRVEHHAAGHSPHVLGRETFTERRIDPERLEEEQVCIRRRGELGVSAAEVHRKPGVLAPVVVPRIELRGTRRVPREVHLGRTRFAVAEHGKRIAVPISRIETRIEDSAGTDGRGYRRVGVDQVVAIHDPREYRQVAETHDRAGFILVLVAEARVRQSTGIVDAEDLVVLAAVGNQARVVRGHVGFVAQQREGQFGLETERVLEIDLVENDAPAGDPRV